MNNPPLEVPRGWTKGEPLAVAAYDQRYCVWQKTEGIALRFFSETDVAYLEFTTLEALNRFSQWWHTKVSNEQQSPA